MTIETATERRPADPRRLDRAFLACQLLATRGSMTSTGLDRELNSWAANAWTEDSQIMVMAERGIVRLAELGFSTSAHWILLPQGWRQLLAEPALVEEGWRWLEQSSTLNEDETRLLALITACAPVGAELLADILRIKPGAVKHLLAQLDGRGLIIQVDKNWLLNPMVEDHVREAKRQKKTCADRIAQRDSDSVAKEKARTVCPDRSSAMADKPLLTESGRQPGMEQLLRSCFFEWQVKLPENLPSVTVERLRRVALRLVSAFRTPQEIRALLVEPHPDLALSPAAVLVLGLDDRALDLAGWADTLPAEPKPDRRFAKREPMLGGRHG